MPQVLIGNRNTNPIYMVSINLIIMPRSAYLGTSGEKRLLVDLRLGLRMDFSVMSHS